MSGGWLSLLVQCTFITADLLTTAPLCCFLAGLCALTVADSLPGVEESLDVLAS